VDRFVNQDDVVNVTAAFEENDVEYVVIGGAAGMLHGSDHGTRDIDLLINMGLRNLVRAASALEALGVAVDDPGKLGWAMTRHTTRGGSQLDVLTRTTGPGGTHLRYDDIARNAELVEAGDGVLVPVATLDDLIMMKEAADRPKDHEALPQLRGLRQIQEALSSLEQPTPGSGDDHSPGLTHGDDNDFGFEI